jgi:proteasome lid subunit RPN8/RPN11
LSYVSISKPVKDRIVRAACETRTEIIGLLLGRLQGDTIVIEDSTTHEFASEKNRVTLPASSLAIIADRLVSGRLKGNIVGWYHSHTEGGVFFSQTDITTQLQLQQFSSLITGIVVDAQTGEVGCFRVAPGTNQAIRLPDENIRVFTDPSEIAQTEPSPPPTVPVPTPTIEVRPRASAAGPSRRVALAIVLVSLLVSVGIVAAVLYNYRNSTPTATAQVMINNVPVSAGTIGTPIVISANVTGPGRNVTLVYAQSGGSVDQAAMQPVGTGQYSYEIPGNQVTGDVTYYIRAFDSAGRMVNTTTYHIAVGDFSLAPQSDTITVYRTTSATLGLQLQMVNGFTGELQLSASGAPNGLGIIFSTNPATAGMTVEMNLTAGATTPNGTYPVTVIASYLPTQSSPVTRQATVAVTVADFQASLTATSSVVPAGSTATFTITLTLQKGFVDPVKITDISGLPKGATYTLTASNPTVLAGGPGTTSVTLQIKIPPFTKVGTYPITIVVSGGGVNHLLTAQIIVR